jgi:NAD(P)-dependent dehydrogenase (short-subunit alcohol dehydrogenase family)
MEIRRDFAGKRAFITGGSRGIGRAVCLELARRGADLAFVYYSRDSEGAYVEAAVRSQGRRALALKLDVADSTAVAQAVERAAGDLGGIDIVVHAAGAGGVWSTVAELAPRDWDRYLAVDLSGAFYVIRSALPHLRRSGDGAIVAISSIAAQMCQSRNTQGAAAKAGLEALVRVVAREEGRHGIRANAVAIGLTDTDMGRAALRQWGAETSERVIGAIPLRRIGTAEEVARAVCFLAGAEGAYITGKVLQVDGGQIIAG